MPYELRLGRLPATTFDTEEDAIAAARAVLLSDPDAEPEVFDTTTGKPCAPGASKSWREELSRRVGF